MKKLYDSLFISSKIRFLLFKKFISCLLIFSITSAECMDLASDMVGGEEFKSIKNTSRQKKKENKIPSDKELIEENVFSTAQDESSKIGVFNQQLANIIDDEELNKHLNSLSESPLVTSIKEHISLISGEKIVKSYGKRKAAILLTLFAGAVVSAIGSLTFLVGEKFPEEFANFTHLNISNSTSNGVGKYLAWSNVVVEALFYTWTISGMLPLLQPEQNDVPLEHERTSYFRQCCSKLTNWRSWLPNFGEWGLAAASAIPLTLVSLIDQEAVTGSFKYAIVGSIGFITLVSNKFFLDLTHRQFKSVGTWLWSCYKTESSLVDVNFLEQAKKAFSESTICANEKLKHLQKKEFKSLVSSLKDVAQIHPTEGETTCDSRWINLTNYMFKDLSFRPNKINKKAIILVPSLGVFAALSWLGLIASVPDGIEKKWSSSPVLQYTFAVLAGIPLIAIGLSMGGSFGLKLSKIGEGIYSVSENITNRIERFSGYSLITLAGLGSFATAATLTIQQFEAIPALTWFLLPCTILGMDLINIASGIELWDEFLIAIKTQSNQDKALFVNHIKFLNSFQKKVETTPANEIAVLLLNLDPSIQKNIIQFLPAMKGKDLNEWNNAIIEALKLEKDQKKILEIKVESSKNGETVD